MHSTVAALMMSRMGRGYQTYTVHTLMVEHIVYGASCEAQFEGELGSCVLIGRVPMQCSLHPKHRISV